MVSSHDQNCAAKLADFGLSGTVDQINQEACFHGTLGYLAPEVMDGSDNIGPPSDIWALGCLLYAMLTA